MGSRRSLVERVVKRGGRVAVLLSCLMVASGCFPSGSYHWGITFGPSDSSQTLAVWHNPEKWVELTADRRHLSSGCTTAWFDWTRPGGGHYDARAVRDCDADPGASQDVSHHWSEHSSVNGMQKTAACTSALEPPSTSPGSNCHTSPSSGSIATFAPFSEESCISWRLRKSNGDVEFNNGGHADDCEN